MKPCNTASTNPGMVLVLLISILITILHLAVQNPEILRVLEVQAVPTAEKNASTQKYQSAVQDP